MSLEQASQPDEATKARQILVGQVRECFGRVVYSHKTHEKCAEMLQGRLATIKLWQIILSAVTTGGFIATLFGAGAAGAVIGGIISTALLALNTYTKDYDLGELAQKHKQAANELWLIREKYISLLADLSIGADPVESFQGRRDELAEELAGVYAGAPGTNYKAYRKAQIALQKAEEMTFSDSEIDAFLPKALKGGSGEKALPESQKQPSLPESTQSSTQSASD
ncbi:MAG: SLATT domain-containing protein [Deltaproteobacteria bacterium]|nr:SLATT domain-containing protein [Deltaproteobacteria bacterium]